MKNRLRVFIALLIAPLAALHAADASRQSKPNIILIYTDDDGYSDLGCMGIMKDVKTPNIDTLASEGVRMTSGYVTAPQCSPSRCGVISGLLAQQPEKVRSLRMQLEQWSQTLIPTGFGEPHISAAASNFFDYYLEGEEGPIDVA